MFLTDGSEGHACLLFFFSAGSAAMFFDGTASGKRGVNLSGSKKGRGKDDENQRAFVDKVQQERQFVFGGGKIFGVVPENNNVLCLFFLLSNLFFINILGTSQRQQTREQAKATVVLQKWWKDMLEVNRTRSSARSELQRELEASSLLVCISLRHSLTE
jgi:hypothetical protein